MFHGIPKVAQKVALNAKVSLNFCNISAGQEKRSGGLCGGAGGGGVSNPRSSFASKINGDKRQIYFCNSLYIYETGLARLERGQRGFGCYLQSDTK